MSSFSIPPLVSGINFDISQFRSGMSTIASEAGRVPGIMAQDIDAPAQQAQQAQRALAGIGTTASEIGAGMASGVSVAQFAMQNFGELVSAFMIDPLLGVVDAAKQAFTAVVDIVGGVAGHFREVGLESIKTGLDPETFSTFAAAANAAGVQTGQFANGLELMQQRASAALHGDQGAAKGFERLGISSQQLAGLLNNPREMLLTVADAMQRLPTEADRVSVAMEAMGRGGKEMLPFLQMGRGGIIAMAEELGNLGARVGTEETKLGATWAKMGAVFSAVWEGLKSALAQPILQYFQDHSKEVMGTVKELAKVLQDGLRQVMTALFAEGQSGGSVLSSIAHGIKESIKLLIPLLQQAVKLARELADLGALGFNGAKWAVHRVEGVFSDEKYRASQLDWKRAEAAASDFGQTVMRPAVTVNANITLDHRAATTEIASKMQPELRKANEDLVVRMASAAAYDKVTGAMGGRHRH